MIALAFVLRDSIPPFAVVTVIGIVVNAYLFRFYQAGKTSPQPTKWTARWEFEPAILGGFSYGRLTLVSILSLFLELLMIRWISSEITMFAYFKNLILIACFLGFGLGCYMCRRRINLFIMVLPLLTIVALVKLPWQGLRELVGKLPSFIGAFSEINFWGVTSQPLTLLSMARLGAAITVVIYMFALISFAFIPVGQLVGWFLENAPKGIRGYSINIAGSLVGIALYTILCFVYQPPAVWLSIAGLMLVALVWRVPFLRYAAASVFLICVVLSALGPGKGTTVYWSPYQKLAITPLWKDGQVISYELNTNGDWYQHMLNLSPQFVAQHPELFKDTDVQWDAYNLPYHFYPNPASVLILGAGSGNDAAGAVRNGAGRVVAVEIDPLILKLGKELHFEKPYDSPRVTTVLDDARSYLQNSDEQFDLIVFSLLDSHTTSSHFTNIRIDNYVYTREAMEAAKRHLRPDGLMIVKFWVATPWIAGRLYGLTQEVFGNPPLAINTQQPLYPTAGTFFISGSQSRIHQALADPALSKYLETHHQVTMEKATLTTDDWPYFYQHEPGLPATVVIISAVLIFLCWFFLRETGMTRQAVLWHFFFLGAGFLLLEAQIVSKMALLFGTTWAVNSVVIGGLLILIIAANVTIDYWSKFPMGLAYAGIFASILAAYLIPLETFFFKSLLLKAASATFVLCLPVFFAGIVFIKSFAAEGFRGEALGSNLLGALFGGLLESLSYRTGIRSLLIFAAILYLTSWLVLRKSASVPQVSAQLGGTR